jgi:hypothetical protein
MRWDADMFDLWGIWARDVGDPHNERRTPKAKSAVSMNNEQHFSCAVFEIEYLWIVYVTLIPFKR